jgi:non-specific protein-tyrosine kinase
MVRLPARWMPTGTDSSMRFLFSRNIRNGVPRLEQLLMAHESESPFAVAGETLMNHLMASVTGEPPHNILLTSAQPEEGKTTVAAHLAITMGLSRKRVLIIDADLRAPSLHEVFGLSPDFGFADILENTKAEEVIQTVDLDPEAVGEPRLLSVITSGRVRPNLHKMFGAEHVKRTLERLGDSFDVIIIDTPPVLAVSDALPLMRLMDGVLLVLKTGESRERDAVAAKTVVTRSGGQLLGVVMNLFDEKRHGDGLSTHHYSSPGAGV